MKRTSRAQRTNGSRGPVPPVLPQEGQGLVEALRGRASMGVWRTAFWVLNVTQRWVLLKGFLPQLLKERLVFKWRAQRDKAPGKPTLQLRVLKEGRGIAGYREIGPGLPAVVGMVGLVGRPAARPELRALRTGSGGPHSPGPTCFSVKFSSGKRLP